MSTPQVADYGPLVLAVVFILAALRRRREVDEMGRVCARYLGWRYASPLVWIVIVVSTVQDWQSGCAPLTDVIITLIGISLFLLAGAAYFWSYRVVLTSETVIRQCWPLPDKVWLVAEVVSTDEEPQSFTLSFNNGTKLRVYRLLSGYKGLVEEVRHRI